MRWMGLRFLLLLAMVWGSCSLSDGQAPSSSTGNLPAPEADLPSALGSLAQRSGFVLVATVASIQHVNGLVEVGLTVESVLAGTLGNEYTLMEWEGLWPPGQTRYVVGQRDLFFLRAPGSAGLSSPVDGADGVVPVFGAPGDGALLDVRRLNARLLRSVGQPLSTRQTVRLTDAAQVITASLPTTVRRPSGAAGNGIRPIVVRAGGAEPLAVRTVAGEPVTLAEQQLEHESTPSGNESAAAVEARHGQQ